MKRLLGALIVMTSLTPAAAADLAGTLAAQGKFAKLLDAAKAAGLDGVMKQPGPYTLFAPTDAAFQALPPAMLASLMKPENKAELAKVLSYHMVTGRIDSRDWKNRKIAVKSAIGMPLTLKGDANQTTVNDGRVSQADLPSDNGVIHVIDQVLLPPVPVVPRT